MRSTTASTASAPTPLRRDAGVIGLVGIAHLVSHFSQLLLPPLFPWLKDALHASYTELGFLMTIFFVVSCAVQTTSGFLVDRFGPRPVLFAGLALVASAAFGFAASPNYWAMAFFAIVAGLGNIYVCEALFRAGINPRRAGGRVSLERLRRLVPAIHAVLEEAILAGGSTLRDYARPDGELGYFSKSFSVYDREGEPCPCGGVVKRFAQGGRSTWYCPACQR